MGKADAVGASVRLLKWCKPNQQMQRVPYFFGVVMSVNIRWTEDEIERLRIVYPNAMPEDLEELFGRHRSTIIAKANALGMRKSKEYLKAVRKRSLDMATDIKAELAKLEKQPKRSKAEVKRIKSGFLIIEGNVTTHRGYT